MKNANHRGVAESCSERVETDVFTKSRRRVEWLGLGFVVWTCASEKEQNYTIHERASETERVMTISITRSLTRTCLDVRARYRQ